MAAYQILGKNDIEMQGSQNSFGMQVFDYSIGSTGMSIEEAARQDLNNIGNIVFTDEV